MPTTPTLALPYPAGSADADVPADLQALAEAVEALLVAQGAELPAVGDFKDSAQTASHGRWLLCDTERELTQSQVEAELGLGAGEAADFAALLGTGSSSMYGSAASGKLKIPGYADVVAVAPGSSHPKKGAGSSGGAETHQHGITLGTSNAADTMDVPDSVEVNIAGVTPGKQAAAAGHRHNLSGHTHAVSGNSGSASSMPPYRVKGHVFIRV